MSKTPTGAALRPAVETGGRANARITSYESALDYLNGRTNLEKSVLTGRDPHVFKLDRMAALMERLGNPERDSRFVHIAGSKGKGSTVEMVGSCLGACGYAVGIYTSPHLVDVRERIRIGPEWIGTADFAKLMDQVAEASAGLSKKLGEVSYFETLTALALLYFAEQAVDIAVMEVGLGGRLDATNIVTPEVCAITAIQLEHTQILGDTLPKIAAEKAGIMKPGVPCLTLEPPDDVLAVFQERAQSTPCPLVIVGKDIDYSYRFEASPELGPHVRVCVSSPRSNYEHMAVPLKGHHQAANCGLALAVLDKLRERGFETPERDVAIGLARTPTHGRMELVWTNPRIIVDGAHTPDSVEALVKAIGAHLRYDSMVAIFGCAADKDVDSMLTKLALGADKVIFTAAPNNPRAAKPADLARRFTEISGKMAQVEPTVKDSINTAHRAVGRGDIICITGSFYVAGEGKRLLCEAKARKGLA